MDKGKIISTIKNVPSYVKEHWNKPNEGEYMSLKEVVAYTAAQSGTYIYATAGNIMTFTASYFCGAIMEIAAMDFYIISLVSNILGYVLMFMNPISVLIYENHGRLDKKTKIYAHICYLGRILVGIGCYFIPSQNFEFIMKGLPQIVGNILIIGGITGYINWIVRRTLCAKYGRVKPLIVLFSIPAAIIISVIPFLPVQNLSYTKKLIILQFAFGLYGFFRDNFINVNNMVQFLTPNSQERQRLLSIVPIITGIFPSIINMIFPILIGTTGGYLNLQTYRTFVPIFALLGALVTLSAASCKERIIEPPIEKRKKVTFWKGAKHVLQNKYLWIINISNISSQWQNLIANLLAWWFIYSLRMEWFSGIAASIVVVGMTLGNLLCPILTKKFQKRDILISFRFLVILTVLGVVLAVKTQNIVVFMIAMFLRNTILPIVDGTNAGLRADILDYHQWKYGERADNMQTVFTWFLNPVTMCLGYILPAVLRSVGFTSDWDVLYDTEIMTHVFSIHTWATIISLVLMTIPFFFYDLTKEKHAQCIKEMQERVKKIEEESKDEAIKEQMAVSEG